MEADLAQPSNDHCWKFWELLPWGSKENGKASPATLSANDSNPLEYFLACLTMQTLCGTGTPVACKKSKESRKRNWVPPTLMTVFKTVHLETLSNHHRWTGEWQFESLIYIFVYAIYRPSFSLGLKVDYSEWSNTGVFKDEVFNKLDNRIDVAKLTRNLKRLKQSINILSRMLISVS